MRPLAKELADLAEFKLVERGNVMVCMFSAIKLYEKRHSGTGYIRYNAELRVAHVMCEAGVAGAQDRYPGHRSFDVSQDLEEQVDRY